MYWIIEPPSAEFAERADETFVMALRVFTSHPVASEFLRYNPDDGQAIRLVSASELKELIESLDFLSHVVVNPLPVTPAYPHPQDVRPVAEFIEGL